MLLREISFSRHVFVGIRRFPVLKLQVQSYFCQKLRFRVVFSCEFNVSPWESGGVWEAVLAREPRQAQGNNAIRVWAKIRRPDLAIYIVIYHTNTDTRSTCTRNLVVFGKAPLKHGLTRVI